MIRELRCGFVAKTTFVDHQRHRPALARLRSSAAVAHDREQPSSGRTATELTEGAERAEHRVLDRIFGKDRIPGEVARKVISPVEVWKDEPIEFVRLAGAGRGTSRRRAVAGRSPTGEEGGGNRLHELAAGSLRHALTTMVPVMCGCREQK